MAINKELEGRLANFKFDQALQMIDDDVTMDEKEVIDALARVFGNCGWLDGDMHTILGAAVQSLVRK